MNNLCFNTLNQQVCFTVTAIKNNLISTTVQLDAKGQVIGDPEGIYDLLGTSCLPPPTYNQVRQILAGQNPPLSQACINRIRNLNSTQRIQLQRFLI